MTWMILGGLVFLAALVVLLLIKQQRLQTQLQQQNNNDSPFQLMQHQLESLRDQVRLSQEGSANLLVKHLDSLNQQISVRLKDSQQLVSDSQKSVGERLDTAAKVVGDLQGKLGKLEEANARLLEVGKDIRGLQEILTTPKLRGNLGEFLLADLLSQILPKENYELQFGFKNNEKADAVVRIGDRLVSIDAKFPLENFKRLVEEPSEEIKKQYRKAFVGDVRKHIDAIADKYIRPNEGTFDFALMYVPAENIYYEVIIKDMATEGEHVLAERAMQRRVIPVSPNTLYVYLRTIVLGLKGLTVEKAAQEILAGLVRLGHDLERIQEAFRKVGVHLHNAQGAYEDTEHRLDKFGDRMERLHGEGPQDVKALEEENKIAMLP
jgi:DNA recombination protein RmuC